MKIRSYLSALLLSISSLTTFATPLYAYQDPFEILLTRYQIQARPWEEQTAPTSKLLVYYPTSITYDFSMARFGDNLMSYMHAKWLSYVYKVPLLYRSFEFSDHLMLDQLEQPLTTQQFKQVIYLNNGANYYDLKKKNILFVVPYFPESKVDYEMYGRQFGWPHYDVDWDNTEFKAQLKKMIRPKKPLRKLKLPEDKISVAIHVRRGTGYDDPQAYKVWPLKFPPDSYFIEQLKYIDDLFNHQPLYVFIFTDHNNPKEIADRYAELLQRPNIQFDYHNKVSINTPQILNDFFDMTRFKVLIRGDSNFSLSLSKIADYAVQISPVHHYFRGDELIYDSVNVHLSPDWEKLIQPGVMKQ